MINGILTGFGIRTAAQRWAALAILVVLAIFVAATSKLPGGSIADKYPAAFEQATVDMCNEAIRFEHPRADAGFTDTSRALPDGSWLAVVPFTIGKLQRQARCVGRADGSFEFAVERAK